MTLESRRRLIVWLAVLALLTANAGVQWLFDQSNQATAKKITLINLTEGEPVVLPQPILRLLSFGNPSAAADLLWLDTIQYFGSAARGDFSSLGPLITAITDLDPKFEYPYEFGLVVLPFFNQAPTAIALGEKAQTVFPNNGLLSFYLATDYQLNLKDYRNAAKYYQKAASEPGSPSAAKELAGISLSQLSNVNDRLLAMAFWQTAADHTQSQDEKTQDENWVAQLKIVYGLEQAAAYYKQKFGHFPATFQDMITAGLISEVPRSPINRELVLDPKDGKVSFDRALPSS